MSPGYCSALGGGTIWCAGVLDSFSFGQILPHSMLPVLIFSASIRNAIGRVLGGKVFNHLQRMGRRAAARERPTFPLHRVSP